MLAQRTAQASGDERGRACEGQRRLLARTDSTLDTVGSKRSVAVVCASTRLARAYRIPNQGQTSLYCTQTLYSIQATALLNPRASPRLSRASFEAGAHIATKASLSHGWAMPCNDAHSHWP
eukprot:2227525-Rhodomonas_salina.1